jgi:hypothetical protein
MRRLAVALMVPLVVAAIGAAAMLLAVRHFERVTGREFYGLAGYHYSVPEWGFAYHPGGERIEDWAVTYPLTATAVVLFASAVTFAVRERRRVWTMVGVLVIHLVVAGAFVLFAAFVSLNVTGVFI